MVKPRQQSAKKAEVDQCGSIEVNPAALWVNLPEIAI
jgi:hypothetical protein